MKSSPTARMAQLTGGGAAPGAAAHVRATRNKEKRRGARSERENGRARRRSRAASEAARESRSKLHKTPLPTPPPKECASSLGKRGNARAGTVASGGIARARIPGHQATGSRCTSRGGNNSSRSVPPYVLCTHRAIGPCQDGAPCPFNHGGASAAAPKANAKAKPRATTMAMTNADYTCSRRYASRPTPRRRCRYGYLKMLAVPLR